MARPNKIEQYDCVEIVRAGLNQGKSTRQLAEECSEKAGVSISHVAVARYIETLEKRDKRQAVAVTMEDRRRVIRNIKQQYDIIQSQLDVSHRMYEQLQTLDDFPSRLDDMHKKLEATIAATGRDINFKVISSYYDSIKSELANYLQELALINREVRENNKFLTQLQEKIYDFGLVQEFIEIFMSEFEREDSAAAARVLQKITANPRMAELVREQRRRKGEE